MSVQTVDASQRLDSRGKPTVQVRITTTHGTFSSLVPSGASKGDYEALELRDDDPALYGGNSVMQAVGNVRNVLGPALIKSKLDPATSLVQIDKLLCDLDGTADKSRLGANAILGVSMAAARAGAAANKVPLYEFLAGEAGMRTDTFVLPVPFFNVINGGEHSGNELAFQEFMIAPVGAKSLADAVRLASETYASLKKTIVAEHGPGAIGIGDEGGFAPPISHPEEALELLTAAIRAIGLEGDVKIGIDPASQSFFDNGTYNLGFKGANSKPRSAAQMAELYHTLISRYPIVLLEDPFGQDDWDAFASFNADCDIELVGDDLLATNVSRVRTGIAKKACNSMLLKINQIGTISEALAAGKEAYGAGWSVFVSHRSGETTDDFIADLTVGLRAGHLKSGAPCRGERVAKYNRLMDIEDDLRARNINAVYAGTDFRFMYRG